MQKEYSRLFHNNSKQTDTYISPNIREWPDRWRKIYYKNYPRLHKVALPRLHAPSRNIFEVIKGRTSQRDYVNENMSLTDIALLLEYSVGEKEMTTHGEFDFPRRAYPSAGHRYPIETYVCIDTTVKDIPSAIFHYDVAGHQLEMIRNQPFDISYKKKFFKEEWMEQASIVIYLTAMFERTMDKYGERGYRFALLEAGEILQNFYLVSGALGLHCCAVGGSRGSDKSVEELLDIDGFDESLVAKLLIGK